MIQVNDPGVLVIGGVVPRSADRAPVDLKVFGSPDHAANVYQWNLINGLEGNLGSPVRIISVPFLSLARGLGGTIRVPGFAWRHSQSASDISVGFINVFGLRNITRELALRRALMRFLPGEGSPGRARLLVFVYAMHGPFLQQLALIKRRRPDAHVCLVVPDLPEHMRDLEHSPAVVRLLKRIDMRRNRACLTHVDSYVLISAHQAEVLGLATQSYVVVEGMVDSDDRIPAGAGPDRGEQCGGAFTVVYTGRLDRRYGVLDLVESLEHLGGRDIRLVLCGDGDSAGAVAAASRRDPRIVYAGQVSREESVAWQRRADVLVNPRPGVADFTRYSFPSKTLEYLDAGKPVLAYPSEGTPAEYDEHLLYVPEPGPEALARAIERVMAMPEDERRAMGARARRFVHDEKSVARQMGRVLALVGGIR